MSIDKKSKRGELVLLTLIAAVVIAIGVHLTTNGKTSINVSEDEVKLRMEYSGYTDVKLGETVTALGTDVFGPCILFTATNEYKAKVRGGFCTPKFSGGEIVVTSRVIENTAEIVEGSYKK